MGNVAGPHSRDGESTSTFCIHNICSEEVCCWRRDAKGTGSGPDPSNRKDLKRGACSCTRVVKATAESKLRRRSQHTRSMREFWLLERIFRMTASDWPSTTLGHIREDPSMILVHNLQTSERLVKDRKEGSSALCSHEWRMISCISSVGSLEIGAVPFCVMLKFMAKELRSPKDANSALASAAVPLQVSSLQGCCGWIVLYVGQTGWSKQK